jgi:hypothetical protein
MRKPISIIAAVLAAASVYAGSEYFRIPLGAATHGTQSVTVRGRVAEVLIDSPAAGVTGTVSVTAAPAISTMAALTLATGTISNDLVVRPAVDMTDNAGAALTSDPPEHPMVFGSVTFAVTNSSSTNVEWRCVIRTEE